jgi:ABC-type cobalamin/Fe3+-siderophores transport system ATPase subunit
VEANDDELFILDEPTNYVKIISNIDFEKWLEAMKSYMDSMYSMNLHEDVYMTQLEGFEFKKFINKVWKQ